MWLPAQLPKGLWGGVVVIPRCTRIRGKLRRRQGDLAMHRAMRRQACGVVAPRWGAVCHGPIGPRCRAVDSIDSDGIWTRSIGPGGRSSCPALCVAHDDKTPRGHEQLTTHLLARSRTRRSSAHPFLTPMHRSRPGAQEPGHVPSSLLVSLRRSCPETHPPLTPPSPWLAGYDTFQD